MLQSISVSDPQSKKLTRLRSELLGGAVYHFHTVFNKSWTRCYLISIDSYELHKNF